MSKKKSVDEQTQTGFVDELLKNGTAVLTAASREELAELVNAIPADCKYAAGAVGFNAESRTFCLRIDIIPAKP